MKVSNILFIIFFFACSQSKKNEPINKGLLGGTEVIVAVASDGIILGADSRVGWRPDHNSRAEKYRDSATKILLVRGQPVGFAGVQTYNGRSIESVVDDFNKLEYRDSPYDVFYNFIKYLSDKYPIKYYSELKKNYYFSGIHIQGKPYIIVGELQDVSGDVGVVKFKNDSFYTTTTNAKNYLNKLFKSNMPSKKLKSLIEKTINHISKEDTTFSVGGPVSIVKILPDNSIEWMQNKFGSGSAWIYIKK